MPSTAQLAELIEQSQELAWLSDASCSTLGVDALDLFFVEAGKSLTKEAVAICEQCPTRVQCLMHAYDNDVAAGYFGGMSPSRRRRLDRAQALAEITR